MLYVAFYYLLFVSIYILITTFRQPKSPVECSATYASLFCRAPILATAAQEELCSDKAAKDSDKEKCADQECKVKVR